MFFPWLMLGTSTSDMWRLFWNEVKLCLKSDLVSNSTHSEGLGNICWEEESLKMSQKDIVEIELRWWFKGLSSYICHIWQPIICMWGTHLKHFELNYHDQKISRTPTYDIYKHWTAVSTFLGLISSVYHDLPHWRSNQQLQIAEPKLYHWAIRLYCTQVTPN